MRNIRLEIEYDGTDYAGWQIQNSGQRAACSVQGKFRETIQGVLERTLQQILKEKVSLISSGRTDAGVHAAGQVANFHTKSKIPLRNLQKALNSLLPADIAVIRVLEAPLNFHSRFSTRSKIYRYTILNRSYPSAFLNRYSFYYPWPLNVRKICRAACELRGRHDFSSFRGAGSKPVRPVRTIKKIKVAKKGSLIYIDIEADGFLYHMARNIVGALLEAGRGKLDTKDIRRILLAKDRRLAPMTAPACGLSLQKVNYG